MMEWKVPLASFFSHLCLFEAAAGRREEVPDNLFLGVNDTSFTNKLEKAEERMEVGNGALLWDPLSQCSSSLFH